MRLFVLRSEPAFLHYFDPTKVSEPAAAAACVSFNLRFTFDLWSPVRGESGV